MKRIAVIIGTQPEAVKLMPVIQALKKEKGILPLTILTGQHKDVGQEIFAFLGVAPIADLSALRKGQSLGELVTRLFDGLSAWLMQLKPDGVLVHGDTASAFAGALAAFHLRTPAFHVAAGLRTYDHSAPFPEEAYRTAIGSLATLHFCPTRRARKALLSEGRKKESFFVTGNTVIDAIRLTKEAEKKGNLPPPTGRYEEAAVDFAPSPEAKLCLFSMHRRENGESELRAGYRAAKKLLSDFPTLHIACTVYPTALSQRIAEEFFKACPRVLLLPPLGIFAYHRLLRRAYFVMTDSGGVQEEGAACHVPVLVLRKNTERPEGIQSGALLLGGTEEEVIYRLAKRLIESPSFYQRIQYAKNPFGDGYAAEKIAKELCYYFDNNSKYVN